MFFHRPAEIVPYSRFLDAHRRRREHVTAPRTPEPVDPETIVVLAPTGTTVEQAAVAGALPDVVPDPAR
jgi:hypothetical protein